MKINQHTLDQRTKGQRFRDTLLLQGTGEVPVWGGFSMATWIRYGDALHDLLDSYPQVEFARVPRGVDPHILVGPANRAGEVCVDNWGCEWHCIRDGMEGQIAVHPLADIRHLRHYCAPDPLVYTERGEHDWGAQDRCLISPATFRRYFKPGYARMYALCKQYGALATQHSDGYTVDLWDEFLEAGMTGLN